MTLILPLPQFKQKCNHTSDTTFNEKNTATLAAAAVTAVTDRMKIVCKLRVSVMHVDRVETAVPPRLTPILIFRQVTVIRNVTIRLIPIMKVLTN